MDKREFDIIDASLRKTSARFKAESNAAVLKQDYERAIDRLHHHLGSETARLDLMVEFAAQGVRAV